MEATLFTPNNLKKSAIKELHTLIEANPNNNYTLVRDYLDGNTKLRRIVIDRYASPDEDKWREQYHTAIYALIGMVVGDDLDDLE